MSKFTKVLPLDEKFLLVVASATVTYMGSAAFDSATSAAVWKVIRMTTTSGGNVTLEAADGGAYTQIFDNRAALSYS